MKTSFVKNAEHRWLKIVTMSDQINIQKAANGYIVSIPFQPRIIDHDHIIRQQARIMKEEFHGDSELMKLKQQDQQTDEQDDFKITSTPNVFVFKTMDELIAFLKTYL